MCTIYGIRGHRLAQLDAALQSDREVQVLLVVYTVAVHSSNRFYGAPRSFKHNRGQCT